jgi:hypothetical protein
MTSPDETAAGTGKVARDAAVKELVSTGIYIALMVGFTLAIAHRDGLARVRMRAQRLICPRPAGWHDGEVARFAADVSAYDHGDRT